MGLWQLQLLRRQLVRLQCLWLLLLFPLWPAQAEQVANTQSASAAPGRSYADRQNPRMSQSGPIYMDPNIYAYTAEFAKRFQMPDEWIVQDLQGADAVAWRMMPSYQQCGWGGNPKACRQVMRCEIDLYFDHQRTPLPWDRTRPERYTIVANASLNFLANFPRYEALNHPNYPVAWRKLFEPARPGGDWSVDNSPFMDPQSGRGLSIQYFSDLGKRSSWGFMSFSGYDTEVFPGMALLTMLVPGCDEEIAAYVLATDYVRPPVSATDPAVVHAIFFPPSWRDRIAQSTQAHRENQEAFFKREGEKAMRALREKQAQ